jgi:DNA polymerase III alpha subunit (gram-positive type)
MANAYITILMATRATHIKTFTSLWFYAILTLYKLLHDIRRIVMDPKTNTRVTFDMPTVDHKKLKILAAYYSKSMREIFIELIERGLETYQECSLDHTPNAVTKKAIENARARKGLHKAESVEDLFKKLRE